MLMLQDTNFSKDHATSTIKVNGGNIILQSFRILPQGYPV
jgi:hypothetical protein